jgi:hypothetical protein
MSSTEKFIIFILLFANLRRDVIHLSEQIEELEQYGRRTSLRFHNVPMRDIDKQRTDNIIVDIVKSKMKMINFSVDDINRSHIIGNINMSINGFTAFVTASATADVMIFFRCTSAFVITFSYILGTIDSQTGSFRSVDLIKSSIL